MKKKRQKLYKKILTLLAIGVLYIGGIQHIKIEAAEELLEIGSSVADLITHTLVEEKQEIIKIQNLQDFLDFAKNCSLDSWSLDKTVVLQTDIYLEDTEFYPIPTFGGNFDGKGHIISGVNITESISPSGLFGVLQDGAVIENLNVSGKVAPSGENHLAGGIAGENYGQIKNCTFTGMVSGSQKIGGIAGINGLQGSIENCRVSGAILGEGMTGGVSGYNLGSVLKCKNTAKVNYISVEPQTSMENLKFDFSMDITQWSEKTLLEMVADIGGIVGYSTGIIQNCDNSGIVGYPHIGYNQGGIVGRSCGYVEACNNYGEIYGRKDVGGIVGQMDPYISIEMTESGISKIQNEMNMLENILEKTEKEANQSSTSVKRRIQRIQTSIKDIQKQLENMKEEAVRKVLGADWLDADGDKQNNSSEAGNQSLSIELIPDKQVTELQVQLQLLQRQLKLLTSESVSGTSTLIKNIQDIAKQTDSLFETTEAVMEEAKELEISDFIADISLENLQKATYGKTTACINVGTIQADRNVGGIVGAMSMETGVDPEDDLTTEFSMEERQQYKLTTIAFQNINRGEVISKKDYVGGICGRMDLGLIANCESYGSVASQNGDYIGGIAGITGSMVQDCFAKCRLSGLNYVGGIVGTGVEEDASGEGSLVAGCYALVDILDCKQFYGAIAGANIGQYEACYFVSEDLPGINYISYAGKAEPITYVELLETTGLPKEFESFTLRFMANGQVVSDIVFEYGDSFESEELPTVPTLNGMPGRWEVLELVNLKKDTIVNAIYELPLFTLASEEKRNDGRAVFLAEGQFAEDSELGVAQGIQRFDRANELGFWGRLTSAKVVEQWRITLPKDGLLVHTLRYLPEELTAEGLELYIGQDGRWKKAERDQAGSYLLLDIAGTNAEIAVVARENHWEIWLPGTALVIFVVAGGIWMVHKKKDIWKWLIGIFAGALIILTIVLAVIAWNGQAGAKLRSIAYGAEIYQMLQNYIHEPQQSMKLELDVVQEEKSSYLEADIFCTRLEEQQVVCLEMAGANFYFANGNLYLENGNAYQVGELSGAYMDRIEQAAGLEITASETAKGRCYQITLQQNESGPENLIWELAGQELQIHTLTANISVKEESKENKLEYISILVKGNLNEKEEKKFTIEAVLRIEESKNTRAEIPDFVKAAILSEDTQIQAVLTRDVLRMYRAWENLYDREPLAAKISLSADCGPLKLEDKLTFLSVTVEETRMNCVQKEDFSVYFNEDTICSERGYAVTSKRAQAVKATDLLELAYELCVQGDFRCIPVEDTYIYSIALDETGMAEIAALIAKESSEMAIRFENGSIQLMVQDEELKNIRFACDGEVDLLLTEVAVALSAEFEIQNSEQYASFSIPEKVVEKLREK